MKESYPFRSTMVRVSPHPYRGYLRELEETLRRMLQRLSSEHRQQQTRLPRFGPQIAETTTPFRMDVIGFTEYLC